MKKTVLLHFLEKLFLPQEHYEWIVHCFISIFVTAFAITPSPLVILATKMLECFLPVLHSTLYITSYLIVVKRLCLMLVI